MTKDELKLNCKRLAANHVGLRGDCYTHTYYVDGWWSANVASVDHCIEVCGFTSETAALKALKRALTK